MMTVFVSRARERKRGLTASAPLENLVPSLMTQTDVRGACRYDYERPLLHGRHQGTQSTVW